MNDNKIPMWFIVIVAVVYSMISMMMMFGKLDLIFGVSSIAWTTIMTFAIIFVEGGLK